MDESFESFDDDDEAAAPLAVQEALSPSISNEAMAVEAALVSELAPASSSSPSFMNILHQQQQQASASASSSSSITTANASAASASGTPKAPQLPRLWDPLNCSDWDPVPSRMCLHRIRRDLMTLYEEPPHGIFAVPDDDTNTLIHALIIGPYDTPYEGGFFYFVLRLPPDYPIRPPRVRLLTTGDDKVRFNPNLYRDGKVCLSILGTWTGPSWSPAQSLTSVLVSIQSLMSENPYHNEPGYDKEHEAGDSQRYNEIIEHETIRVAVCGALEERYKSDARCPQPLKDVMKRSFPQFYDHYVAVCRRSAPTHQGAPMRDPFGERRGKFEPNELLQRLETLKRRLGCGDSDSGGGGGAISSAGGGGSGSGAGGGGASCSRSNSSEPMDQGGTSAIH